METESSNTEDKPTIKIQVAGMSCMHCVNTVKEAIEAVPGVESATVDLSSGWAEIVHSGEENTDEKIRKAIINAGYKVIK